MNNKKENKYNKKKQKKTRSRKESEAFPIELRLRQYKLGICANSCYMTASVFY